MDFRFRITFLFCWASLFSFSQEANVSNHMPDSLNENTNALVVFSNIDVEVYSTTSFKLKVHNVTTVYNQQGVDQATFALPYDKFRKPSNIKISTYGPLRTNERKVKQNELIDAALSDGFSIYNDDRIKYYKPVVDVFPFTIEYSYEIDFVGYTSLPSWDPVPGFNVSVLYSSYSIEFSEDLGLRYKLLNNCSQPNTSFSKAKKKLTWVLANFKAIKPEPFSPEKAYLAPRVLIGCNQFGYDGYPGDFSSWSSFGKWAADLLVGRQELPVESQAKILALLNGIENPKEKAAILYQYLQEHMRYVSIQLGIGGFQPFSAAEVDKWGYGDCKALSNYYVSLLKLAGIKGIYTITNSSNDNDGFHKDFPANIYFNHVVVCIPFENDTTWVECTNNYYPFGYMGRRVAGQPALLVTDSGGVLTKIPHLSGDKNNEFRNLNIRLAEDGNAQIKLQIRYLGEQLGTGLSQFTKSKTEQIKSIYTNLELKEIELLSHVYSYDKGSNPCVSMSATLQSKGIAQLSGNRMFIPIQMLDNPFKTPEPIELRRLPVKLTSSYYDCDTITIDLPKGFAVEMLPKSVRSSTEFGDYEFSALANQQQVMLIRSLRLKAGTHSPETYATLREHFLKIYKSEKQKLVLRNAN